MPRLRDHSSSRLLFDDSTVVVAKRSETTSVASPETSGLRLKTVVLTSTTSTDAVTQRVRCQLSTTTVTASIRPIVPPRDRESSTPSTTAATAAKATGRRPVSLATASASSGTPASCRYAA